MGRGNLNEEEIRTLRKNPYVVDVNERGVSYSKDFKFLFIKEYMQGKKPGIQEDRARMREVERVIRSRHSRRQIGQAREVRKRRSTPH